MATSIQKNNNVIALRDKDFNKAVKLFESPTIDLNKVNSVALKMKSAKKVNIKIH
ncbi:hypothetical protein [Listeria grandensis]|uniref:hypothetical protein n=1 Tax=Listeria grandensis TaxID=1494963 RepID=UPI0004BCCB76|nr:hypothetical protein [Listeria grandensis]